MRFEPTNGKLEAAFKDFQRLPEWPMGRVLEKGQKLMEWPALQNLSFSVRRLSDRGIPPVAEGSVSKE
jgi:hypothetical protein